MAKPSLRNLDRVAAILLFCTLCGVLLGIGARAVRLRKQGAARPPVVAVAPPPAHTSPVADLGTLDAAPPRPSIDGGIASQGNAPGGRALLVLVLDGRGQPVKGATVFARVDPAPSELASPPSLTSRPPVKSAPTPIGELGVLPGPLPFPEDVISGAYSPQGLVQRGSGGGAELSAATDAKGLARLYPLPVGRLQLLVNFDGKSATAEVVVAAAPAEAPLESEATALRIVLRLAPPLDSLCTLPGEPDASGDAAAVAGTGEGPEVAGRVEDPRGFPVSGARLELTVGRVRTQTLSDPRGGFSARGLPGGTLSLQVHHAGFAPLAVSFAADKPRGELRLKLLPGGGIAGMIRDGRAGGVPPGTQLYAETDGGLRQAVAINADGSFSATGLVPGELTLHARAPGYAPLAQPVKVAAADTPGEVTVRDVRLELWHSATLRGRVFGDGGDAAGATVTITLLGPSGSQHQVAQVVTDARGEFTANELPPGKLRITASAGAVRAHGEVDLQAGDNAHTELELR